MIIRSLDEKGSLWELLFYSNYTSGGYQEVGYTMCIVVGLHNCIWY